MSRFLDCLHTGKASVRPGIRSADTKQREGKEKEKKKEGNAYYAHTCFATRWKSPPSSRSYFLISYFHGMRRRRVPACHPRSLHVFAVHVPPDGKNRASLRYATMEGNTGAQGEGIRINVSKIHFGEIRKFYIYIYIDEIWRRVSRGISFFFSCKLSTVERNKVEFVPEEEFIFLEEVFIWSELDGIVANMCGINYRIDGRR